MQCLSSSYLFLPLGVSSDKQYWLDVFQPTQKSLDIIEKHLKLHPLTCEDVLVESLFKQARSHRQKVEAFENYIFMASTEVQQGTYSQVYSGSSLTSHDLFCAVFPNLIITWHRDKLTSINSAREKLAQTMDDVAEDNLHPTVEWILYALLDSLIYQQSKIIELVDTESETLDELILSATTNDQGDFMRRISSARRRCSYLERELEEKHALLSALTSGAARRAMGGHDATSAHINVSKLFIVGENLVGQEDLFRAIYEVNLSADIRLHLRDVVADIESMQDTLSNINDTITNTAAVYLSRVNILLAEGSNDMTKAQKFFAAVATIALPLGLITSAWGQNVGVPGGKPEDGSAPDVRWWFGILGSIFAFAAFILFIFWRCRLL